MNAPQLILIVAVADNGIIGRDNGLPWRLPADLKRFRSLTIDKTILMGRKTFESLGRLLDRREHWVLTRDKTFAPAGVRVFHDLDEVLKQALPELYVIGGAELYRQTLPLARRLELTQVHMSAEGDTHFPPFDRAAWQEVARQDCKADEKNPVAYSFVTLVHD
jgi:dihydrofolate reductase